MIIKAVKYWLPALLWAGFIFYLSSGTVGAVGVTYWQDFVIKSLAHVAEYGILTALLYRALLNSGVDKTRSAIYSLLFAVVYAATDEFHQFFVPGREARFHDVLFDTIGGSLALYSIWKLLPKMPVRLVTLAKALEVI